MFVILHILTWHRRKTFIRTILNDIPDNVKYICLISANYDIIDRIKNGNIIDEENIKGLNYFNNVNEINNSNSEKRKIKYFLKKIFKKNNKIFLFFRTDLFFEKIITSNFYNAIILTTVPSEIYVNKLLNIVSSDKKIYYIHHGISILSDYNKILNTWSKNIYFFLCDIRTFDFVKNNLTNKIFKINGLPQFDYILKNKQLIIKNKINIYKKLNIRKDKKTILIVGGSKRNTENDIDLINLIKNILCDYHIILKNKIPVRSIDIDRYNIPNFSLLDHNEIIYDYFCCDIIIVIEGGTTFIESLLINPKTVLYQINDYTNDQEDNYRIYNYNLLIIKEKKKLKNILINLDRNNIKKKYLTKINDYIKFIIGDNIEKVSEIICNIILNNYELGYK